MRLRFLAAMIGAVLLAMPAQAENKIPSPEMQEILIKTYLLSLNDANLTENYTVLQAKIAKPFRDQFSPDRLKQVFKEFATKKIDFGLIAAKPPVARSPAVIDNRGALQLRGYFDTRPSRVIYELDFLPSEGEWKPIKLNVDLKHADGG